MKRLLCSIAAVTVVTTAAQPASAREIGDTTVFARVGAPGMPEGIAVRDGVVYVGTHTSVRGNSGEGPSKIFRYDLDTGALLGEISIRGQALNATHGILAMAFDAAGRLYVLDRNPPRMIRIDPVAGSQEDYATIPNLASCRPVIGPETNCSPTTVDEPAFPDYFAFDAAGNAYMTDLQAATIFRIPAGGGPAQIWYQDARFDGIFGLNGIAVDPTGTRLYFAMTGSQQPMTPAEGIIYSLPITDAPTPDDLQTHFVYLEPATGPDGIAFGASGKLYVALAGSNQLSIIDLAAGTERRFPDAVANQSEEIPYDLPASIAFDGEGSILLTNQSFFAADATHWAVLDVYVADTAQPLVEPVI